MSESVVKTFILKATQNKVVNKDIIFTFNNTL